VKLFLRDLSILGDPKLDFSASLIYRHPEKRADIKSFTWLSTWRLRDIIQIHQNAGKNDR
jgi:hypothetical protein